MASFQAPNYVPNFAPYIPEINPDQYEKTQETYVQGGLQKQRQYDQNYQKIQGLVDSIGGLQVSRDVDKQYVNQKMGELSNNLSKIAGQDLSQISVLQQAGGFAAQIYNDRAVQNAVISTKNEQDALSQIQLAHKEGKSSQTNDHAVLRNIQQWRQDPNAGSQLGKQQYTNFFDYQKGFQDFMKDKHGNVIVEQTPGIGGQGGWSAYTLVDNKRVSLDPLQVENDAETYFQSNAQAKGQLDIDSLYYVDNTPNEAALAAFRYTNNLNQRNIDYQIADLEKQKSLYPEKSVDIETKIDFYRDAKAKNALIYSKEEEEFITNPQSAKAKLYQQNIISGFANRFAYQDLESKIVKNPIFEAGMDVEKLNLDKQKFDWSQQSWQLDYEQKERHAKKLADIASGTIIGGQFDAAAAEKYTPQDYENDLKSMASQVTQNQARALYESGAYSNLVTVGKDSRGQTIYVRRPEVSYEQWQQGFREFTKSYEDNPQGASRAAKEYFADQFSDNSPIGLERAYFAEAKRFQNLNQEIEDKYKNDADYRAVQNYNREMNRPGVHVARGITRGGALITEAAEIEKRYSKNIANLSSKVEADKKRALQDILLNDSQATISKAKDAKNSDEFAAIISYASNQPDRAAQFNEVTGEKGAGEIIFGYTKNPVTQQLVAFARNSKGTTATVDLDPITASRLSPQLTQKSKYSGQERLLLANQGKYSNIQSKTGTWYNPQKSNLSKYDIRYDIQKNGNGTGYAPIIQYKPRGQQTSYKTLPYQVDFQPTLEQANVWVEQMAAQGDAVFENTFLK